MTTPRLKIYEYGRTEASPRKNKSFPEISVFYVSIVNSVAALLGDNFEKKTGGKHKTQRLLLVLYLLPLRTKKIFSA